MKNIDILFGSMDACRHLPNYQLERRSDLVDGFEGTAVRDC